MAVNGGYMKDIIISLSAETNDVKLNKYEMGIAGEHLQRKFIVDFMDAFVDGTATLEYLKSSGEKGHLELTRGDKEYSAFVVETLTTEKDKVKFQVKIVQAETEQGTPIFKSKIFTLGVGEGINATEQME